MRCEPEGRSKIVKTEFQSFNDGVCVIYNTDDNDSPEKELERLRYEDRVIGTKRFYGAMAVNIAINKLIRVPMRKWLDGSCKIVIKEGEKEVIYDILQTQHIGDKNPPVTDLTLKKVGVKYGNI